jgi:hypothetical protein
MGYLARGAGIWLVMMGVETMHGLLRTLFLAPALGDLRARQVSILPGAALLLLVAWALHRWLAAPSRGALLQVGLLWVLLTFAFECALGRLAFGYPWERVLAEYDPRRGGFMAFGLLWLAACPLLAARLHRPAPTPPA